jgi:hypothetical protein
VNELLTTGFQYKIISHDRQKSTFFYSKICRWVRSQRVHRTVRGRTISSMNSMGGMSQGMSPMGPEQQNFQNLMQQLHHMGGGMQGAGMQGGMMNQPDMNMQMPGVGIMQGMQGLSMGGGMQAMGKGNNANAVRLFHQRIEMLDVTSTIFSLCFCNIIDQVHVVGTTRVCMMGYANLLVCQNSSHWNARSSSELSTCRCRVWATWV